MTEPVAVGLVGAGPWATWVHGPTLAAGPHTRLAAVWARRPDAATELAERHGAAAAGSIDELLDRCEAVAFAVPPAVQAELAVRAAAAGKALLLEKPIAADLDGAERLAAAVAEAGVGSMVALTWRYTTATRSLLAEAAGRSFVGGTGVFLSGALLGGPFATPWRLERGPLLDLGPHVVDVLDAALGPVVGVRAHGRRTGWVGLQLEHEGGAVSDVSLCASLPLDPSRSEVRLYGPDGELVLDANQAIDHRTFPTVAEELAAVVRTGDPHPLDVLRGLHLQRTLAEADQQLG